MAAIRPFVCGHSLPVQWISPGNVWNLQFYVDCTSADRDYQRRNGAREVFGRVIAVFRRLPFERRAIASSLLRRLIRIKTTGKRRNE